ncbi:MAG: hypothetical protein R3264_00925, partial [Anaerolineae bacterium]|nr:hypothetical protein [Anaerolineae bacterium]
MNTVSHISSQSPPTFQKLQTKIWSALRDPRALLILLPLQFMVWLLMMALPQQLDPELAASSNREALWLAELPTWLQAI